MRKKILSILLCCCMILTFLPTTALAATSNTKYDVVVTPAENMTKTDSSGEESQSDLNSAMIPVVYTANEGYYFPETYTVNVITMSGITVRRDSETQITVYGTPTANARITLAAPSLKPIELESIIFGYAYDVQRSLIGSIESGITISMFGLDKPLLSDRFIRKDTNEGDWTLTKAGTYYYVKNTNKGTGNLANIVDDVSEIYGVTEKEGIVIHELKDGDTHIAYGVVIAYIANNGYAVFFGDNILGGAGYLLSTTAISDDRVEVEATMVATDSVPVINYGIALNPSDTYTFETAMVGYGAQQAKTVTVTNTGNGATGDLNVALNGANANSFTLSKTGISSIAISDSDTFTVVPKSGLSAGTYTATVTVSGNNGISASFDVSFTVNNAAHICAPILIPQVDATYTTDGCKGYYQCSDCNKYFSDRACTREITDLDAWKSGDGRIPAISLVPDDSDDEYDNEYVYDPKESIENYYEGKEGWQKISGAWYYFGGNGKLTIGWVEDKDGKWYCMDEDTGEMQTGWVCSKKSGLWYFMDTVNGDMKANCWLCDQRSGRWYYLGSNGAMCTGWIFVDNNWYLLGSDGAMLIGWQMVGDKEYYLDESGKCLINTTTHDGFKVDETGAKIK